jgi:hypothetical protein
VDAVPQAVIDKKGVAELEDSGDHCYQERERDRELDNGVSTPTFSFVSGFH